MWLHFLVDYYILLVSLLSVNNHSTKEPPMDLSCSRGLKKGLKKEMETAPKMGMS